MAVAVPALKAPKGKTRRGGRVGRRSSWWRLLWRFFAPYAALLYVLGAVYLIGNGLQAMGDSLLADQKSHVKALQRDVQSAQAELDSLKAPWRVAQFARESLMEVLPQAPLAAGASPKKTNLAQLP